MFGNVRRIQNLLQDIEGFGLSFEFSHPFVFGCEGQRRQLKAHSCQTDHRTVGRISNHASVGRHRSQRFERSELGRLQQGFVIGIEDPWRSFSANLRKNRRQGTRRSQEYSQHFFPILSP